MKLLFVITFTHDIESMKKFYRDGVGLDIASETLSFISFQTGGTPFSLLAVQPGQKRETELCFEAEDIESQVAAARGRGVTFFDEIRPLEFGKVIHMRDPEGNLLSFLEPQATPRGTASAGARISADAAPRAAARAMSESRNSNPLLSSVIINTWDFGTALRFYRDRLSLVVLHETPHWVELDAGGTRLLLHARAERPDVPRHASQKQAWTLEVEDVSAWCDRATERGVELTTEPTEEEFGFYAELTDPDGNLVVLREPPPAVPLPEKIAEAFEDDAAPARASFRKPVKKRSKALSRVVLKPEYKESKESKKKSAKREAAASTNGSKRARPKRAKVRPAIGRLRKAERRTLETKKESVASASKTKPVKHKVAARGKSR